MSLMVPRTPVPPTLSLTSRHVSSSSNLAVSLALIIAYASGPVGNRKGMWSFCNVLNRHLASSLGSTKPSLRAGFEMAPSMRFTGSDGSLYAG